MILVNDLAEGWSHAGALVLHWICDLGSVQALDVLFLCFYAARAMPSPCLAGIQFSSTFCWKLKSGQNGCWGPRLEGEVLRVADECHSNFEVVNSEVLAGPWEAQAEGEQCLFSCRSSNLFKNLKWCCPHEHKLPIHFLYCQGFLLASEHRKLMWNRGFSIIVHGKKPPIRRPSLMKMRRVSGWTPAISASRTWQRCELVVHSMISGSNDRNTE